MHRAWIATHENMHKNMLPTSVAACAAGALCKASSMSWRTANITSTKTTYVYGRRLTIVQLTPGEIVCGAVAISWRAVEFGCPLELICAK